jgi:Xaa-Pro aminopeptidase
MTDSERLRARRAEVDEKQAWLAGVLDAAGCEGVLVQDPSNFAWLSAGALLPPGTPVGELPCLYFGTNQRWLVCCNTDTQALFDDHLDNLGFQLKERPWHSARVQHLAELCHGRKAASDLPLNGCAPLGEPLRQRRLTLSARERAVLLYLGRVLAHALEATARNLLPGDTEWKAAGQLAHRLFQHGVTPVAVRAAADGRARSYRRPTCTETAVERFCVLEATGMREGLHATASRTVCFGEPDPRLREEHDLACRVSVGHLAATRPDGSTADAIAAGLALAHRGGMVHEPRTAAPLLFTGYRPAEAVPTPRGNERFLADGAVVWQVALGAGRCCDTFLTADPTPVAVTPPEPDAWPIKRVRLQGSLFDRPDLYVRQG